jgi:hypothetical protein
MFEWIESLRKQKAEMESRADDLESGRWSWGSFVNGVRVDESASEAADQRSRAAGLGRIISAWERRNS